METDNVLVEIPTGVPWLVRVQRSDLLPSNWVSLTPEERSTWIRVNRHILNT